MSQSGGACPEGELGRPAHQRRRQTACCGCCRRLRPSAPRRHARGGRASPMADGNSVLFSPPSLHQPCRTPGGNPKPDARVPEANSVATASGRTYNVCPGLAACDCVSPLHVDQASIRKVSLARASQEARVYSYSYSWSPGLECPRTRRSASPTLHNQASSAFPAVVHRSPFILPTWRWAGVHGGMGETTVHRPKRKRRRTFVVWRQ
jgi:hypothetical protein